MERTPASERTREKLKALTAVIDDTKIGHLIDAIDH